MSRRRSTVRSFTNKALICQETQMRETVVTENGKVVAGDSVLSSNSSDTPSQFYQFPYEYNFADVKRSRPLRLKRKLYEFYTAPITKFWANSIAYVFFLFIFSYAVLVKMEDEPSWQELYVISYICTFGCEKIREIVSSEPVAISHKFAVWSWNMWNPCDAAAIIFFLIGLSLRLQPPSKLAGRVLYCVDIIYWYLRILNILGVNKYLGPLVTMMGKMVKNMIYFVVLLLVVMVSFGVCRQSILNPNEEASWLLARNVAFEPYFMLYGEVFADNIDPPCGDDPKMVACLIGRWIPPIVMAVYLLVANILLINLLIAVFNNIFIEVNAISHQVWMFQRFTVVMEYEQKPTLPPPLIFFSHIFLLLKFLIRKIQGIQETYDNGLKLFLDSEDLERLYDFEEECVEGYFREKETRLQLSTEERIKQMAERAENIQQKVEDINQKENSQNSSIQGVEFRIRKLEELSEQTLSTLTVIHRFMAAHSNVGQSTVSIDPDPEMRLDSTAFKRMRYPSEHSDVQSEVSEFGHGSINGHSGTILKRRGQVVRSFTEIHPSQHHGVTNSFFVGESALRCTKDHMDQETTTDKEKETDSKKMPENETHCTEIKHGRILRRQKTSFSLDGEVKPSDVEINGKGRQGSLGHLDAFTLPKATEFDSVSLHRSSLRQSDSSGSSSCGGVTGGPQRTVTWAEPRITVIPPSTNTGRSHLMAMHTEYTSITDELESMCGLLSPPRSPRLLSPPRRSDSGAQHSNLPRQRTRHASEMSNSEIAAYLEKETLRDAEECDYELMQDLIRQRIHRDVSNDEAKFDNNAFFLINEAEKRKEAKLHRSGAIELGDGSTDLNDPVVDLSTDVPSLDNDASIATVLENCDINTITQPVEEKPHQSAESYESALQSSEERPSQNIETIC